MSVTSPSRKTSLTKRRSSEEESYVSSSSLSQESESLESIIKKKLGIKKGKKKSDLFQKQFVFRNYTGEGHGQSIYSAQFNQTLINRKIFATVGANQVSTFECLEEGYSITPIRVFADPDANEIFYSLAWSYNVTDRSPLIAVSGLRGLIRIFSFEEMRNVVNLRGHGESLATLSETKPHLVIFSSSRERAKVSPETPSFIIVGQQRPFGAVVEHKEQESYSHFWGR